MKYFVSLEFDNLYLWNSLSMKPEMIMMVASDVYISTYIYTLSKRKINVLEKMNLAISIK